MNSKLKGSIALGLIVCSTACFTGLTSAQAPQAAASEDRSYPAPTNLHVLPKSMTGAQVHEIMEQWESDLGAKCSTCHAADPNNVGPNGRPRLNFADDSKQEKGIARMMYTMTEQMNRDFIKKIDTSGVPVSCGTCHRGHIGPLPYVPAQ